MGLATATVLLGATHAPSGGAATAVLSKGSTLDKNTLYFDDASSILMQKNDQC